MFFLESLKVGAFATASAQLLTYVDGNVPFPPTGSEVIKALEIELKSTYSKLTPEIKKQFDSIVAAVKAKNSGAWVSNVALK